MAYELGGRADKFGNRFEYNWTISKVLDVVQEKIEFITLEAIGENEEGVDLWVGNKDGSCEGQQCKGRSGSEESWSYGTVNAKGIFTKWKNQLERDIKNHVSLVSPLAFTLFEDLTVRARNTSINPDDFYEYQIKKSGQETRNLFKNYCKVMGIDTTNENQIHMEIDYLSRSFYRQIPDSELKNIVIERINILFYGDSKEVYNKLLSFILTEDILGKRIDSTYIYKYLIESGVEYRNLAKDRRILPRIHELNKEYKENFIPLKNGVFERNEFATCKDIISKGKSLVIHGGAGVGKSGCTENIIHYCEQNTIPYLAIKLDKRIPTGTSEIWGKSMGLSTSPALCLEAISKDKKAILIMDQLDSLRWTQAHSGVSLEICLQIIREIQSINNERHEKIVVVMVTRTYDLKNDIGIKTLFNTSEDKKIEWQEVQVKNLSEENVKDIVGGNYERFSKKMKELLRTPSNLYIWQQLELQDEYINIDTTRHLIEKWWGQLQKRADKVTLNALELNNIKNRFVEFCDRHGRINAPANTMGLSSNYIDFLQSNGFMIIDKRIVSFVHQSILDCFLSDYMLDEFYDGKCIEEIIGDRSKQKPGRRYQVQLFMQQLLETSEEDFITVGESMLCSVNIRFNVKYVFLEVLSLIECPSEFIAEYVIDKLEDNEWYGHFLNCVVKENCGYVNALQRRGILDSWIKQNYKKDSVINLLVSISHDLSEDCVELIKRYSFISEEDDKKWSRCFGWKINEDSETLFELRMQYYDHYPELLNQYLNIKDMMMECELRTIRVLALMLKAKYKKNGKTLLKYEEDFVIEESEIIVRHYKEIVSLFLPLLPKVDDALFYSEWSERYSYNVGIERACVQILKKANRKYAKLEPEEFLCKYREFQLTGNELYNEILLDGLCYLSDKYADDIVAYLCNDFEKTLFESTSGNGDRLFLGKKVISKVSKVCSQELYSLLENKIMHYFSTAAVERLQRRMSYNNEKNGYYAYWRFWGDFQLECLRVLPEYRLTDTAKQMLCMLNRSIGDDTSIYRYNDGHSGNVFSPVSGKKLSIKNWINIITNNKIPSNESGKWKEVEGGFVESTKEEFSSSFKEFVSDNPEEILKYMLSIEREISDIYIDCLFDGIAYSSHLDEVEDDLIESMFNKYSYDYKSYRAVTICRIVEKKKNVRWSQRTFDIIKDIAKNHENPMIEKPNVIPNEDKEIKYVDSIESNAINSARGEAACVIGHLLWDNKELYTIFKDTIELLVNDINPIVQYASLYSLWPVYNIDKEWAIQKILLLYKKDYRMAGFCDSKTMFFFLYKEHKDVILNLIMECFESDDKRLIKIAGLSIAEMYMQYNEFQDIVISTESQSKEQQESILEMLILYLGIPKYNEKAKIILSSLMVKNVDLELSWARLFNDKRIEYDRDKMFLINLLTSKHSRKIIHAFVNYLEEDNRELIDYNEMIIKTCNKLLQDYKTEKQDYWDVQDELSKLTLALYDATCDNPLERYKTIASECLDIWNQMFETQIGEARSLTRKMMELE
ncbi:MAG: hypothetical protein Q4G58_04730 [bacterium]|nr:hypothetical protein [bacterium]